MSHKKSVCILGGLGHVGLPLGLSLAKHGIHVTLIDIDEKKISEVSEGKMPFLETGAEEVLKQTLGKTLSITSNKRAMLESDYIVVVIGTPVDEHLNPKFTIFKRFFDELLDYIKDEHHVILRSTVYPGTTEKIKKYLESKNKKTRVSFCPERISQGQAMDELHQLPQIVASFDSASAEEAGALFSVLTQDLLFLSPIEAELAKLFTNVYRYILFSISNQFFQIASSHGLDFYKIYHAITHHYPRAKNLPTPGFAAGPCLFKDTMQLAAFSNNNFFLGHAAMLINEGLPNFLVQSLKEKHDLLEKKVGILGMAFKANNDDKRESLSYKLKKILDIEAQEVFCSDVYIREEGFLSSEQLIEKSDIVILGTPHREYKNLTIPQGKIVLDIWNFLEKGGN